MREVYQAQKNSRTFFHLLGPIVFFSFIVLSMVLLCHSDYAYSAQATLTWQPSSDPDVQGYKIYYGTASETYTMMADAGNSTTYNIINLANGTTYYFAATAYDAMGEESADSNEVSMTAIQHYTLTAVLSGGGSGTITGSGINCSSNCTATYNSGSIVTLTATANAGSTFTGWSGGVCTGTGLCSFNINSNQSVTAAFNTAASYTITASASSGGSISPAGTVPANAGTSPSFTVTPNSGYNIANVTVDNVSVGAVSSYSFSSIAANHTIAASFSPITYTLATSTTGTGSGTVASNPSGTVFSSGTAVTLTASPAAGSSFAGWSGACSGTSSKCTVTMTANASATATFNTVPTYTITASASSGGSISPAGTVPANAGTSPSFTVTPNSGYNIANVTVDGISVGAVSSYSFSSIAANHTITASFSPITYTLATSKTGTGSGTVASNPSGTVFNSGTAVTLTATPAAGSSFAGWSGACSGTSSKCTVTMNANATATATFNANGITYKITANSGNGGGHISPSGTIAVANGGTQTYIMTPSAGFGIQSLKVDNIPIQSTNSYTFTNITSSHTISVVFKK